MFFERRRYTSRAGMHGDFIRLRQVGDAPAIRVRPMPKI
jgi:hypothetical protein